jgi:hypothetical protein
MAAEPKLNIPVLTDAIGEDAPPLETQQSRAAEALAVERTLTADREMLIAELQTQIAASMFALIDETMRTAFAEIEATVFEQISGRLRRELPDMIDTLLRERIGDDTDY